MKVVLCISAHWGTQWKDAVLAYEAGCQGIVLSNHGGRQLEVCENLTSYKTVGSCFVLFQFARSGIEVLVEVVHALKERGMHPDSSFQIFVDGGVRRASDVLKAIALGATAGSFVIPG